MSQISPVLVGCAVQSHGLESFEIEVPVGVGSKNRLTIVASLGDVVGCSDDNETLFAGHNGVSVLLHSNRRKLMLYKGLLSFTPVPGLPLCPGPPPLCPGPPPVPGLPLSLISPVPDLSLISVSLRRCRSMHKVQYLGCAEKTRTCSVLGRNENRLIAWQVLACGESILSDHTELAAVRSDHEGWPILVVVSLLGCPLHHSAQDMFMIYGIA